MNTYIKISLIFLLSINCTILAAQIKTSVSTKPQPAQSKPKTSSSVAVSNPNANKQILKIIPDADGYLKIDGEDFGLIKANEVKKVPVSKGNILISFISADFNIIRFDSTYDVVDVNIEKVFRIYIESYTEYMRFESLKNTYRRTFNDGLYEDENGNKYSIKQNGNYFELINTDDEDQKIKGNFMSDSRIDGEIILYSDNIVLEDDYDSPGKFCSICNSYIMTNISGYVAGFSSNGKISSLNITFSVPQKELGVGGSNANNAPCCTFVDGDSFFMKIELIR
jgi:hypothetical protein